MELIIWDGTNMEEECEEECEDKLSIKNIRLNYFDTVAYVRDIRKKEIGGYLKKLKNNGDDFKIKQIKKLYQIYNMFYKTLRIMICEEVYHNNGNSIDDFYCFLSTILHCTSHDIYKFICLIQDDNFDYGEILREKPEEFNLYSKYEHF